MRPHTHARSGETGLTLVELTIAAFVGAVVLAGAVSLLTTLGNGADREASRAAAAIAVDQAVHRLRQDVTAARARDRASSAVYDQLDFAAAIRNGSRLRGYDADGVTIRDLDVQDVVLASRSTLVLSSSDPRGTQCVRWQVRAGALVRDQLGGTDTGCATGLPVTRTRAMISPSADGRSSVADPFSYAVATPGAGGCTTAIRTSVPAGSRGAVVAVLVDLQALEGHRQTRGSSGRVIRIDLRSRLAEEYQRALGCAR